MTICGTRLLAGSLAATALSIPFGLINAASQFDLYSFDRPNHRPVARRSKNPATKRKLKANRCHISKRVRRKLRRAA